MAQTACLSPAAFLVAQTPRAQLQAELAGATDAQAEEIRAEFDAREKAFEHSLDHEQRDVRMMIQCSYSTRRPPPRRALPAVTLTPFPPTDFLSK